MSHSYVKIWIHGVWATKDRMRLIGPDIENKVYQHIAKQLREQSCQDIIVNGMPEHVHCLFM